MKQKNSAETIVVITDANILIDLKNANLVDALLRTEWRVITTDFVFEELNPSTIAVDSFGIEVINLSGVEIAEIFEIRQNHNRLSIPDISALILAEKIDGILLTGDKRLKSLCLKRNKIGVHGVLWILDQLVNLKIIDSNHAIKAIFKMKFKGARLPEKECQELISKWKEL